MLKACFNCANRCSYPDQELCRETKREIIISLEAGKDCQKWQQRSCVLCTWKYTPRTEIENVVCPRLPVNSCPMFLT